MPPDTHMQLPLTVMGIMRPLLKEYVPLQVWYGDTLSPPEFLVLI